MSIEGSDGSRQKGGSTRVSAEIAAVHRASVSVVGPPGRGWMANVTRRRKRCSSTTGAGADGGGTSPSLRSFVRGRDRFGAGPRNRPLSSGRIRPSGRSVVSACCSALHDDGVGFGRSTGFSDSGAPVEPLNGRRGLDPAPGAASIAWGLRQPSKSSPPTTRAHRRKEANTETARSIRDGGRLAAAATGSGLGTGAGVTFEPGRTDVERVRLLEEALELLGGDDPDLEVWVLSYLVVALQDDPDATRRAAASGQAEALAERIGAPRLLSAAAIARRLALADLDAAMDVRLATGRRAIDEGDRAGEMPLRIVSRLGHLADLVRAGDLDGHARVLAEVDELVGGLRQRRWHWFLETARAGQALAAGRYDEAARQIDGALERVGRAQGVAPERTHALQRLLLERDLGRVEASVERLVALPGQPLGDTLRTAALGLALVAAGDLDRAGERYRQVAAEGFASVPRNQLWLLTVSWLAETAAALGDAQGCEELDQLLEGREDRLVALGGAGVAGSVARVRGLLAGVAGSAERAVDLHARALAVHERLGLRPWAARSASELASALRAAGDRGGERSARERADDLAGRIGLVLPPGAAG